MVKYTYYVCYRLGKLTIEMLFSINEGTVNVFDVATKVRNGFWDASLIFVNSNGPRIEDSDGSCGN